MNVHNTALTPNVLSPQDLQPNWNWEGRLPAWGHTSVDFERRVDHDRLRRYRLTYPERTVHLQIGHAPDGRIFRIRDV